MSDRPPVPDRRALAALGIDDAAIALREALDGEPARRFLAALPALVRECTTELGLRDPELLPGGVLSAVLRCVRVADGAPVVLKLTAPQDVAVPAEAAALSAWAGNGACRLLWSAPDGHALLLCAIVPGTAVSPRDEAGDVDRAAALLHRLHLAAAEAPAAIPDARTELDWRFARAAALLGGPSHARPWISRERLGQAHADALALHAGCEDRRLLHGDFLDKNLLLDGAGEWWAIDPRPCLGDPCLDGAFWALAHRPGVGVRERCESLTVAAGWPAGRVWAWARVFTVCETVLALTPALAQANVAVLGSTDDG
jgi:streptomycin 6-kinase